jgi:hypothetical protein
MLYVGEGTPNWSTHFQHARNANNMAAVSRAWNVDSAFKKSIFYGTWPTRFHTSFLLYSMNRFSPHNPSYFFLFCYPFFCLPDTITRLNQLTATQRQEVLACSLASSASDFPARTQLELRSIIGIRPMGSPFLITRCWPLVYSVQRTNQLCNTLQYRYVSMECLA